MPDNSETAFFDETAAAANAAELAVRQSSQRMRRALEQFSQTQQKTGRTSRDFARSLERAFENAAIKGESLSDVFGALVLDLSRAALRQAFSPVGAAGGNLLASIFGAASGAVFAAGRVQPMAQGGVVNSPTFFPLRRGIGLAGEAGPEAVLPLARGADGRLGVRTQQDSRPVQIQMTIQTPNPESFRQSQTQIAAALRRAVGRGGRNL